MGTTADRLIILVTPLLAFATYVIGQFIAATVRKQDTPRVERDSMLASAERAVSIMHSAMIELQERVAELEGRVAKLETENARLITENNRLSTLLGRGAQKGWQDPVG